MQTRITAHQTTATDQLRAYAEQSVSKLNRYYDGIHDVHVVLKDDPSPTADKRAEIALHVYRQTLNASDSAPTHEAAIDGCVRQLRRQVSRYKDRLRDTRTGAIPRP
ncbi:MAG: ribosome-associated translation inhibitor RaiA [Rhodothermaceae bacterium]|nr:ribosome-associated translation inhibitor RaiA [Rhodothermaceae bacterium]